MKVEIRLFATLRRLIPEMQEKGWVIVDVEDGATIRHLMTQFGIPMDETKVIMKNFRQAGPDESLSDGDRVAFIPAVGGG
ncbi:MAG: MoaD/ThiS family protein [Anaerolineaceae bacterium]|jgi:molybdopterin converting factor small subunit